MQKSPSTFGTGKRETRVSSSKCLVIVVLVLHYCLYLRPALNHPFDDRLEYSMFIPRSVLGHPIWVRFPWSNESIGIANPAWIKGTTSIPEKKHEIPFHPGIPR